jgi:hypothetical protein
MPAVAEDQRVWEAWFGKITDLQNMFKDLPASLIIPSVTGSLKTDDRRIYGWHDKTLAMQHSGRDPSLAEFIAHVRKQVLSTNTTRRAAAIELASLRDDCTQLEDCMALSTKLKQLFAQLYPPHSDEVEPMTRLQAAKHVHQTLASVLRGRAKHRLVRAWRSFTSYDAADMFAKYLDESLHAVPGRSTEQIVTQYLADICAQLEQAHRMFVQTEDLADDAVRLSGAGSVNAAARLLQIKPHVLATWVRDRSGQTPAKKRGRSSSAHRSPGAAGRSAAASRSGKQGRGAAGRGSSTPPKAPGEMGRLTESQLEALKKMRWSHPDLALGSIRAPGQPAMPFDEAFTAVKDGACMLCQSATHQMPLCPLRTNSATQETAGKFVKQFRAVGYTKKASVSPPAK